MNSLWARELVNNHAHAKHPLSMFTALRSDIKEIAVQVAETGRTWNLVEIYTATNARDEKQKYLDSRRKGRSYTPLLSYNSNDQIDVKKSSEILRACREKLSIVNDEDETSILHKDIINQKIDDDLRTCAIIEGIREKNDEKIGSAISAKYVGCDSWLLEQASHTYAKVCERTPQPLSKNLKNTLSPSQLLSHFIPPLSQFAVPNVSFQFGIRIDANATAVDVRDKSFHGPSIVIPAHLECPEYEAHLLVAHEINGHVRQTLNGKITLGVLADILRLDDETLYEGLAMRLEVACYQQLGLLEELQRFLGASCCTAFAVQLAEQGASFEQIYEDQLDRILHVDLAIPAGQNLPAQNLISKDIFESAERRACSRTYRILRSHIDCSNKTPFAMAKDLAYFRGWLLDSELVRLGHGYMNELSILSLKGLSVISNFAWNESVLRFSLPDDCLQFENQFQTKRSLAS